MSAKQWKILIIGDRFVTNELFREAMERHLAGIQDEIIYKFMENGWPDEPWNRIEEVHEAVGDVEELRTEVRDVDILVTHLAPVTKRVIEAAKKLKLIATPRGGPVNINAKAAQERGIPVANLPGRNARAVAEFAMGMILAQIKKIAECDADMKRGIWRGDWYRYEKAPADLMGKVAGLVGFGRVGRLLPPMLKGFDMKVIAYDPLIDQRIISEGGAEPVDLETLLKRSDIVSLHARITQDNVHMIGEKQLKMMKPSAYFINSARAALVDHKSLYRALKEGWIAGAAIDVYDSEPIDPKDPLLGLTNITFTPHIAGSSKQVAINAAEGMAIEVERFLRKQPLLNPFKSS